MTSRYAATVEAAIPTDRCRPDQAAQLLATPGPFLPQLKRPPAGAHCFIATVRDDSLRGRLELTFTVRGVRALNSVGAIVLAVACVRDSPQLAALLTEPLQGATKLLADVEALDA